MEEGAGAGEVEEESRGEIEDGAVSSKAAIPLKRRDCDFSTSRAREEDEAEEAEEAEAVAARDTEADDEETGVEAATGFAESGERKAGCGEGGEAAASVSGDGSDTGGEETADAGGTAGRGGNKSSGGVNTREPKG